MTVRERTERGAILPFVAGTLAVIVLMAAMAVDLGKQRVARADMQALADVVALDLARQLTGVAKSSYSTSALNAVRDASVARNLASKGAGTIGKQSTVTYELGSLVNGVFVPSPNGTDRPTAVRTTALTSVGFGFVPGLGSASRSSVAVSAAGGCVKLGSFLVGLDTSNSALLNAVLGNLLGTTVNAGVLGYNGLATSSISLASLAVELGVATPEALVQQAAISYGDFSLAVVKALQRDHPEQTGNIALLNTIRTKLGSLPMIKVSDLVSVATGSSMAAAAAQLNVLDLIEGAALIATPAGGITVPGLNINVAGLTQVGVKLNVIEPPQIGCGLAGVATASTSQVKLTISAKISAIGLIGGDATVTLNVANSDGLLTAIGCTTGSPTSETVSMTTQSAASLTTHLDLTTILLGTIARVDLSTTTPGPGTSYTVPLPSGYTTGVQTSGTTTTIPTATAPNVTVLGLPLGFTVGTLLSGVVNPVVGLLNSVLSSVTSQLGVKVAGADIFGVKTPTCSSPRLLGTP